MGVLLLGVVALAVLILVGYGIYSFATDKAIPFVKYLPNFMTKDRKVEGIEKLRYKIVEDKVQYYDKTDWLDFKDEKVELGEKTLIEDNVKNDFKDYYFNENVRLKEDLDLNYKIEPYKSIRDKAIAWRDGILKKPVEINYYTRDGEKLTKADMPVRTCINKIGADLIVDLTEE